MSIYDDIYICNSNYEGYINIHETLNNKIIISLKCKNIENYKLFENHNMIYIKNILDEFSNSLKFKKILDYKIDIILIDSHNFYIYLYK